MNFSSNAQKTLKTTYVFAAFLALCFAPSFAHADAKGEKIAQASYDRPDGKTAVSQIEMVLERRGSQPRSRQFFSYRKDFPNDVVKSLIRFTMPADVSDTGMLTQSNSEGENDQWLYLPETSSVRRISGDRKGGRFVGSDLFFEDLQDRKVKQDIHTFVGDETYNGALCHVIESVPADKNNSTYSKKRVWIHPQTLIALRVDFYQGASKRPVKQMIVSKIDKVDGYWTVMDSKMTDLKNGHTTYLRTHSMKYDVNLPDTLFSQSILQDSARELSYRP